MHEIYTTLVSFTYDGIIYNKDIDIVDPPQYLIDNHLVRKKLKITQEPLELLLDNSSNVFII